MQKQKLPNTPVTVERSTDECVFGEQIKTMLLVGKTRVSPSVRDTIGVETTLASFKKEPAFLRVSHGNASKFFTLNDLVYKKILVGTYRVPSKEAEDLIDMITLENALSCFKMVRIKVDLKRANPKFCVPDDADFNKEIHVYPCMGKFYFNGEEIELNEASILKAMKCYTKVLDKNPSGNCFKMGNYFYRLEEKSLEGADDRSKRVVLSNYRKALKTFVKGSVDTSGSLRGKITLLNYLNVGSGVVPIDHSYIKQIGEGKFPRCFAYRDAKDNAEKVEQPFNSGSSDVHFLPKGTKDAIIVGYTDKYIDSVLNEWF